MEELMEILEEIRPDLDFEEETALLTDRVLSSFDMLQIVSEIFDEYGVEVTPAEMIPANFDSAEKIWAMIGERSE